MPVITRLLNGKMNLDVSNYAVPPGDFTDALNITRDSKGQAQDKIVANINGNTLVDYTLPAGQNKVIGSFADLIRNRVYYFVWNSQGYNLWLYFDGGTGTITKLIKDLTDTNNVAVLDFNPSKRINHVDVINRDDDGDLVMWTDDNTTPKCANVSRVLNGDYTVIKSSFIEMAKKPFLAPPTCVYGTDTTKNSNAVSRAKMWQVTSRPCYDDFQKATFSGYSKVPLPVGYYGSDNDTTNTANNFITITVETGDEDVSHIEIAARYNNGNNWSDFIQIAYLNKSELLIPDNSTYQFLFYNDAIYPPVSLADSLPLFSYVPPLAAAQCLGNGNTPIYGNITEGYPNYPVSQLDVTITATNKTNLPPDTLPTGITYTMGGSTISFSVNGSVPVGTVYKIYIFFNGDPGIGQTYGVRLVGDYTSVFGDTVNTVASALYSDFNSYSAVPIITGSNAANTWNSVFGVSGCYVQRIDVTPGPPVAGSISTEKTWLWDCPYIFGLAYKDEQGRIMPGVTTFANPVDSANDFLVTTPIISFDGSFNMKTPVIDASVNHIPPAGAVSYAWVRRRLQYDNFLMYMTCDYQSDTNYLYFCLANVEAYRADNTKFVYATAPVTNTSRIRILAGITSSVYNGNVWNQDYEILGTVTKTITGGTTPDFDRTFIKVKKPAGAISPAYQFNMLVMVYTPKVNPTTLADSVYWEFGQEYGIYSSSGVNYHRGQLQDQTVSQPATFEFTEGDVYFHKRNMYSTLLTIPGAGPTLNIMDAGFSDFFASSVNDDGRALSIDVNARTQKNPVLVRFGNSFEAGTNINDINSFYALSFDEYDRSRGDIMKLFLDKRRMAVFHKFDVGIVPVYTQVIQDTSGNPLQANSTQLLNKITYPYIGKFGIGDVPESFAYGKGAMYFVDSNKGMVCRLSQDGIKAVSVEFDCSAFFISVLAAVGKGLDNGLPTPGLSYTGNPTVYGNFDYYTDKYILSIEQINRYAASTSLFITNFTTSNDGGVAFAGTVTTGLTITVIIRADNGETLTVTYVTVGGDTKTTIRNAISALVNASVTFTASTFNLSSFPGFPTSVGAYPGSEFHNVAGGTTTAVGYISGALAFHQDPYTLSFNETRDTMEGFESFYSYAPEELVSLNNLSITFKNGALWRHDSTVYNNFYGVQYGSTITPCFNDNIGTKKTFERISYLANQIWVSDTNGDINTSDTNPQTGLEQISKLRDFDYTIDENVRVCSFLRDINSNLLPLEGLYNGDFLKGVWIECKLKYYGGSYAFIYLLRVGYSVSQKNS